MVLKRHHCVVSISNQLASPFETRPRHFLEPLIQHIVQINVCEQRRDHAALGRTIGRAMDDPDFIAESRRLCRELKRQLPQIHAPSSEATFKTEAGVTVTAKIPSKLAAVVGS